MALVPNQIAELERLGIENVRTMVHMSGKAQRSEVPLDTTGDNLAREDVEEWLSQKEASVARRRHRRTMGWQITAAVVTGIGAGTAVLEALQWWSWGT